MQEETSCGVIPLQKLPNGWHVLLIQHHAGHYWSFPKGHAELDEDTLQTAVRELHEETGLTITKLLSETPIVEKYQFVKTGKVIHKTVIYFAAEVIGELILQKKEVRAAKWVPLKEAALSITYPTAKSLCQHVIDLVA